MALQSRTENSPLQSCSGLLEVIRLIYVSINQSAEEPFEAWHWTFSSC